MKYRVHWLIGDVESDHHDLEILFSDRNKPPASQNCDKAALGNGIGNYQQS